MSTRTAPTLFFLSAVSTAARQVGFIAVAMSWCWLELDSQARVCRRLATRPRLFSSRLAIWCRLGAMSTSTVCAVARGGRVL
jgi:hypothetical protein